jgi:pimeloyl-ACP methyl ester carboxylesterase
VVVAHSMGGTIATAAAERAPSLFAHLVYVTAFAPVAGLPAGAYMAMPECATSKVAELVAADPGQVGALRLSVDDRPEAVRACFYGDVDRDTAYGAIGLLGPDSPAGFITETVPVTRERYGTVPHSYVVCTEDNALPEPLQRRFIAEIDAVSAAPTGVTEMVSSHSPFLSRPGDLADAVRSIVEAGDSTTRRA